MPYQFKYNINNQTHFTGYLQHQRCTHINPNTNIRCKRNTIIGLGLCWQHLKSDDHLRIKNSTIPNAGKGLFATNSSNDDRIIFKPNDTISKYNGQMINQNTLYNRYGEHTGVYAYRINSNLYEDGALHRGVGNLPNHKERGYNAKLITSWERTPANKFVKVKAVKNIKNNQEIFVDYGDNYHFNEPGISYSTKYKRN